MRHTKISTVICAIVYTLLNIGCTKTEYETEMKPYTDVLSVYLSDQYLGKDQLRGVISKDSITVYWNPELQTPTQITPIIEIAEGATISPASGTPISFDGKTVYTVTAENGQTKEYVFHVKKTQEVPVFTAVVGTLDYLNILEGSSWSVTPLTQERSGVYLNLLGEYFLAGGNVSDIKVYAQRVHDGFEFDLPLDTATVTNTNLRVELPKFSNQQDTGMHKIWIKVGDLVSDSKNFFMRSPNFASGGTVTSVLKQHNQEVYPGQTLTFDYNYTDRYDGALTRYYKPEHLHIVLLGLRAVERIDTTVNPRTGVETYRTIYKNKTFQIQDFTATDSKVDFVLPAEAEEFVGGHIMSVQFLYNFINQHGIWTHLSGDMAVQYGQTTVMYSQRGTTSYTTIGSAKNRN
ncbi:hypothetical protein [Sphingobacterium corticibacter]|uniref:DUF5018 domain-containing protein n=1 Tax=Sphingobacterium corticibacter TaxID=2171749 RepID=A0A2T8HGH6_9SPHI|nr:hypothetical protein [Sphingobacterium corticibacter]PVH24551.1 hypothetical protein DC487_13535 [Sphingobacterium corticibacter]